MQNRYNAVSGFATIPSSGGRYSISLEGIVRDDRNRTLPTITESDGHRYIYADLWNGHGRYQLALLMAFAFKPHYLPLKYWNLLTVLFVDGDQNNCHPGNLVWEYPDDGLVFEEMPEFKYIPGFTRYVINEFGTLYSLITGRFKKPTTRKFGYVNYASLRADVGDKPFETGRHRLVALAWLPYPGDVDSLQVNHLNSIPGDDYKSNLEWTTRIGNMQHAKSADRLSKSKAVLTRNIYSGEVKRYQCMLDCAKDIGVKGSTVIYRAAQESQLVYAGGLQFKLEVDDSPWREVDPTEMEECSGPKAEAFKVMNLETGEVRHYRSMPKAAKEIGVSTSSVFNRLQEEQYRDKPIRGYVVRYLSDQRPW